MSTNCVIFNHNLDESSCQSQKTDDGDLELELWNKTLFKWSRLHDQHGSHAHIREKRVKIFFSGPGLSGLIVLKFHLKHH